MIAVVAALSREIAGLVRGIKPDAALLKRGIYLYRTQDAVVVAAGMGAARCTVAVEAAMATGGITELLSIGLAGACAVGLRAGAVLEPKDVVDARTGERFISSNFPAEGGTGITLVTLDHIASVREKARLRETYHAAIVDMEAATVARLAAAHSLRFRAIKAVSDEHDFELAALGQFTGKHGSFRAGAFALHTALRPHRWAAAIRLGRGSTVALAALERHIHQSLQFMG